MHDGIGRSGQDPMNNNNNEWGIGAPTLVSPYSFLPASDDRGLTAEVSFMATIISDLRLTDRQSNGKALSSPWTRRVPGDWLSTVKCSIRCGSGVVSPL